ncbi:MAG: lytic murein transglycosylase [Patescibacteria group bacterium]
MQLFLISLVIVVASFAVATSVEASELPKDVEEMFFEQPNLVEQSTTEEENKKLTEEEHLKEIEKQVEFASEATGVRKGFLMGMLVVESNLGRNTGKCTYQEVKDDAEADHNRGALSETAWKTFKRREEIMKKLANELGRDYDELSVSCNPPYNGTGGAMGIPQFMPDTWKEYEDRIAEATGEENPDPWSLRDGVMAMALKVADVPGVTNHNVWAERNASKMYLSGSTSGKYEWYASDIQYWSRNYSSLIS